MRVVLKKKANNNKQLFKRKNKPCKWRWSCSLYQKQIKMKKIILFKKQSKIWKILTNQKNKILELLIWGGAGWSKTFTGTLRILYMALTYPWTRRGIWRSKMKTLKATTLKTLLMIMKNYFWFVEGVDYKITWSNDAKTPNTIILKNGSEILLLDLKLYPSLDPDFDDLGSLELTGGFIDEAVQITEKAYQVFSTRIWRRLNNKYWLKPMLLLSCNPWKNRVYQLFYKPQKNGTIEPHKKFIQVLAKDNEYIPKDYLEKMELMPEGPMKQRLVYGNWEYDDDALKVYSYRDLQSIFGNVWTTGEKYIIADVAGQGADDTIITVWDWRKIIDTVIEWKSTPESVKHLMLQKQMQYWVKLKNMLYDWTWLWWGLSWLGCEIFQWSRKPIETKDATQQEKEVFQKTYNNLRSQCFFMLAKYIQHWDLAIPNISDELKTRIIEELDTIQTRKIDKDWPLQIIPKDEIRKLIWRSPDFADVISMRVYFELIEREEPHFY